MSTSSVIKVNFCNYIKKKISIHPATDKNIKEKKKKKKSKTNPKIQLRKDNYCCTRTKLLPKTLQKLFIFV